MSVHALFGALSDPTRFAIVERLLAAGDMTAGELAELFTRVKASLNPGGTLLLCHWRHPVSGWELDGETVHAMARQQLRWPTEGLYREKDFILEVFAVPAGIPTVR